SLRDALVAIEPVGTAFIRLATMIVVPLVIGSLFTAIASLGDVRRFGAIGGRTLGYFLTTTLMAATIGLLVASLVPVHTVPRLPAQTAEPPPAARAAGGGKNGRVAAGRDAERVATTGRAHSAESVRRGGTGRAASAHRRRVFVRGRRDSLA